MIASQMRLAVLLAAACGLSGGLLRADVFCLRNGGQLRGTWTNRQATAPAVYEVTTPEGGRLSLPASLVRKVLDENPKLAEYEQVAIPQPDTIAGHWQVAEWCRENGLKEQRRLHLQRILQMDPEHTGARYGLGYSQFRGRWATREEVQRSRGLQLYDGEWRLSQETQLAEEQQTLDRRQRFWATQLRRWREAMATGAAQQAYEELSQVTDPLAVQALALLLREEPYREVKKLYVETLARIGNDAAIATLVDGTMQDPDEEMFHLYLDEIVRRKPPQVARRYVDMLRDGNNVRVNRAAYALGRLHDATALSPLIDALQTTHCIVLPKQSDAYTATFAKTDASGSPSAPASPLGGTGFHAGDDTQVIPVTVNNQQVLEALIRLSGGADFGFDRRAWRDWLLAENRRTTPTIDSRRDAN